MVESRRTALVTGGARRIGRAIVKDLARHGFAVAIHCNRSREAAEELAADLRAQGCEARVFQADLADTAATAGLVDAATWALGPLGLLVNSASIFEADSVLDIDPALWSRQLDVNLRAPVLLTGSFASALSGPGLVVNILDQRVWRLTPRYFSYTLSKAALWTATQTAAQALAPRIRVNAIGPGPTLANTRQSAADFQAQIDGLIGNAPSLAEFGATIRYLWDNPSVTGQMIALDGGQHLAWETPDVTGMNE